MKEVTILTLNRRRFLIEVDDSNTVGFIKDQLSLYTGFSPQYLRAAFNGKILSDESTVMSEGIEDGGTIVVFPFRKKPVQAVPRPSKLDVGSGSADKTDKPDSKVKAEIESGLTTPIPDFKTPQMNFERRQTESSSLPVNQISLRSLMEMGFEENRCRKALLLNRMNLQRSMNWLLQHADDENIDEKLNEDELEDVQREWNEFEPDENVIESLENMGFECESITEVLFSTNNDQDAALSMLLMADNE